MENIIINTKFDFRNQVTAQHNEIFTKEMWKKMQTAGRNTTSISSTTTLLKYFNLSVNSTFNNVLTNKTIERFYNPISGNIETDTKNHIAGYTTFNTSASIQTTLYGMLKFGKNSKIQAIRHVFTPSIGFSYTPDFSSNMWGYYKDYYDTNGIAVPYSIFEGSIYGSPSSGLSKSINFNLSNNLEIKVKSKKDSTGVQKIKIFENIGINFSYNAAATNFKWSHITINAQNSFFKNKLNLNYNASFDPYKIHFEPNNDIGTRIDKLGNFRLQYFNLTASFSLHDILKSSNKNKKTPENIYKTRGTGMNEVYHFDEDNYARFNQDWTLDVNTSYSYNNSIRRFGESAASIGLNGSIKLTPYWNITGSAHYDLVNKSFAYSRLGFSRDQRSFSINFNWVPTGQYKVYDFYIGIKATILKDAVKYEARSFNQSTNSL